MKLADNFVQSQINRGRVSNPLYFSRMVTGYGRRISMELENRLLNQVDRTTKVGTYIYQYLGS